MSNSAYFELRWYILTETEEYEHGRWGTCVREHNYPPKLQYREGLIGKWTDVPTVRETKTR